MPFPGDRFLRVARRVLRARTVTQILEPTVADWQREHRDAVSQNAFWQARWILFFGLLTLAKVLAMVFLHEGLAAMRFTAHTAFGRVLLFSIVAGVSLTALIAVNPLMMIWSRTQSVPLVLYHLPQPVPVAIPVGLTIGVLYGLRTVAVSRRLGASILLLASLGAATSFVATGWVVPKANELVLARFGVANRTHPAEMTTPELWGKVREPGLGTRSHQQALHSRLALAAGTLVLVGLALGLAATRQRSAVGAVGLSVGLLGLYWFLLERGEALSRALVVPIAVGTWSANVACGLLTLLVLLRRRRMLQSLSKQA